MKHISKALRMARDKGITVLPATRTFIHEWKKPSYLNPVSIHQMAPRRLRYGTPDCSLLLNYRPQKNERLSWPGWWTCSGRFTHISCRSSTGQGKFAGKSPVFHHCATQYHVFVWKNAFIWKKLCNYMPLQYPTSNSELSINKIWFSEFNYLIWMTYDHGVTAVRSWCTNGLLNN